MKLIMIFVIHTLQYLNILFKKIMYISINKTWAAIWQRITSCYEGEGCYKWETHIKNEPNSFVAPAGTIKHSQVN